MQLTYPLTFALDGLTRNLIWGGSKLKHLVPSYPDDVPLAEIWMISDRPEDGRVGMVANGPLAGVSLTELMAWFPTELLGRVNPINGKFPLLIKFLDPTVAFSLQVHPNDVAAKKLGTESKTEFWTLLDGTDLGTVVTVGLKKDVTRAHFESSLRAGEDLTPLLHQMTVKPGDTLDVFAGRLHSMGSGALMYEVQENSNATYRVFDWNRIDAKTGKPRALHIDEALTSIDFTDIEPTLQVPTIRREKSAIVEELIETPYFTNERWTCNDQVDHYPAKTGSFDVITVTNGTLSVTAGGETVTLNPLQTCLVPAAVPEYTVFPDGSATYIRTFVRT